SGDSARNEGNHSVEQLKRIEALGGGVAAILEQDKSGHMSTQPAPVGTNPVPYKCMGSDQAFVQAYYFLLNQKQRDQHQGLDTATVGLGSDFNAPLLQPAPRYGGDACTGNANGYVGPQAQKVTYPFIASSGQSLAMMSILDRNNKILRSFNYNS